MTDIFILPQDILSDSQEAGNPVFIHKHSSQQNSPKTKILLQQNLISILQSGEKILHYMNQTTVINETQLAILSSGNCLMREKISTGTGFCSFLVFFDNATLANFFIKYAPLIKKLKSKRYLKEVPFVVIDKDDFVQNYVASLDFMLHNSHLMSSEMKHLKFEELMLYLLGKYPEVVLSFQPSGKNEYSGFEIKKAVEQNITNNITIEELAFLCNTSVSTFKRRFLKLYNTSPNQYFLQRRMEMAALLLTHHNESPSEVFYKVGYENLSSFSQSFKHIYGVSPRQYQQQNLNVYQ